MSDLARKPKIYRECGAWRVSWPSDYEAGKRESFHCPDFAWALTKANAYWEFHYGGGKAALFNSLIGLGEQVDGKEFWGTQNV